MSSEAPHRNRFVGLIKECTASNDLKRGYALHADVARLGLLEGDMFICSALVDMYAKCGSVAKAQEVFDRLLYQDVVSWTALIAGYSEHGPYEQAFTCIKHMEHDGICPNSFTFVCLLRACSHLGSTNKGEEIHIEIVSKGLGQEEIIGNSIVDMYAKCGNLVAAYAVFCQLEVQSVISWTALIAGYVNSGQIKDAFTFFEQMHYRGSSPNIVTLLCMLKGCGSIVAIDVGQRVHTEIVLRGFDHDIHIGNTLTDMYFKFALLKDAEASLDKLPFHDIVSWNILLAGYSEHYSGEGAFTIFEDMQAKGFSLDEGSCTSLLRACSRLRNTHKGMGLHLIITKTGIDKQLPVANMLVDMYGKLGLVSEARHVFDNLLVRSLASWNALITGHAEHARAEMALTYIKEMETDGFSPDVITCVCSLKACGSIGSTRKGEEIHLEIVKLGMEAELSIANGLIHMYAKCGSPAEAQKTFNNSSAHDVVSWTALMVGWAQFGQARTVLVLFNNMIEEGVTPNSITLACVLNACSDEGLLLVDQNYLSAISNEAGLVPTLEHYSCIVDLFGRAGLIDEAIRTTEEMPMSPDVVIWLAVLGACRNWGNVELGKAAFESALRLDCTSETAYLCMYNIFVEAGMHDEAFTVELRRRAATGGIKRLQLPTRLSLPSVSSLHSCEF